MRFLILLALVLSPVTAHAWTVELTDPNSGGRECQDLPFTDSMGNTINKPDDFIAEVEKTSDPNPMVDYDSGETTIIYHNNQNGTSIMKFFGTARACKQYVNYENQHS